MRVSEITTPTSSRSGKNTSKPLTPASINFSISSAVNSVLDSASTSPGGSICDVVHEVGAFEIFSRCRQAGDLGLLDFLEDVWGDLAPLGDHRFALVVHDGFRETSPDQTLRHFAIERFLVNDDRIRSVETA